MWPSHYRGTQWRGEPLDACLEAGRSPKVLTKDETRIRTLICNLHKSEGGPAVCYIHALPEYSGQLEQWLKTLNVGVE